MSGQGQFGFRVNLLSPSKGPLSHFAVPGNIIRNATGLVTDRKTS